MSLLSQTHMTYTNGRFCLGTKENLLEIKVNSMDYTVNVPPTAGWQTILFNNPSAYSYSYDLVMKPTEEPKKQENKPTMKTKTVTRPFRLTSNNHTEYDMEARLTGTEHKLVITGGDSELKDLFEAAKVGDEFLFVVIKQPKAEKDK